MEYEIEQMVFKKFMAYDEERRRKERMLRAGMCAGMVALGIMVTLIVILKDDQN
jgi:hypothetical protein